MDGSLIEAIVEQVRTLPVEAQEQVLAFAVALRRASRQGVAGRRLLPFANSIPADDVAIIREAIEIGCEQIDRDEW
ncbi:MAG: hypothetical protein D6759_12545 [Chloroflexi bacterium]|nr:MAG: hypothetical protein D6759_12545 [Chloroflexota bacterium]